ncbi:MAG TPA: hypothetical protein VKN35_13320, partial [Xanthomonadales bacterium]|nr:hypothetical protein [Xanthomonadales bacterium]
MSKRQGSITQNITEQATKTKRDITRRDFIHDLSLGALGMSMPITLMASAAGEAGVSAYYPPTLTGL